MFPIVRSWIWARATSTSAIARSRWPTARGGASSSARVWRSLRPDALHSCIPASRIPAPDPESRIYAAGASWSGSLIGLAITIRIRDARMRDAGMNGWRDSLCSIALARRLNGEPE